MSASYGAAMARDVKNQHSIEAKIDKLAEAIDHLARAVADLESEVKKIKARV
jgi:outer membrane murein-binding lipoprotein Lpp